MYQIKARSANEAYLKAAELIREEALEVRGRQQGTLYELRDVAIEITEPRKCLVSVPWRKLSRKYAAAEFVLFEGENTDVEAYAHYAKKWKELDVDGEVCSAYGARMFSSKRDPNPVSRFEYALEQLLSNSDSKNAVIMMRDWTDNRPSHQKDRCCTLFVQFTIRNGKLDMLVYMRSSDFWFGLPYDVFWYSSVMQKMLFRYNTRAHAEVTLGTYTHICTSLHVYKAQTAKMPSAPIKHNPTVDYEFPEWDICAELEKVFMVDWERRLRLGEYTVAEAAVRLRNQKLHPFMETIGSYFVNAINTRLATDEEKELIKRAERAAGNSRCIDRQVGCVIICEDGYISSACNEVIACDQNCADKVNRVCDVLHAEVVAVSQAKGLGHKPIAAYVTLCPCLPCMDRLKADGVKEIVVKGFSHKGAAGEITLIDPAFF